MKNLSAPQLKNTEQANLVNDTLELNHAIQEGMADFIVEVLTRENLNEQITQGSKEVKSPASPWYYIGYEICESYFNRATDKQQAIYNMMRDDITHDEKLRNIITS